MVRFPACSFSFSFLVCHFFHLFLFGAAWLHNRVALGPDIPGIILLYDVLYPCVFVHRVLLPLLLLLCVAILLFLLYQLLLFVTACRMATIVAGSSNLIHLLFSFSSFSNTMYFKCIYPSAVLSHLRPRFAYTASSVITGMRGAKEGVSPLRRSPPCRYITPWLT